MLFLFLFSLLIFFYLIFYFYFNLNYDVIVFYFIFFLAFIFLGFIFLDDFTSLFNSKHFTNNVVLNIFLFVLIIFILYNLFSFFIKSFCYSLKINIFYTISDYRDGHISLINFLLFMLFYFLIILFSVFILYSVSAILVGALISIKSSIVTCFTSCTGRGRGGNNRSTHVGWAQMPGNRHVDPERYENEHICYKGCTDGGPGIFQHQVYYNKHASFNLYLCIKCGLGRISCRCWDCPRCERRLIWCECELKNAHLCSFHGSPRFQCPCHYMRECWRCGHPKSDCNCF